MADKPKCLTPECENNARSRGLCGVCYMAISDMVTKQKTTWDELVKAGLALPSKNFRPGNIRRAIEEFRKRNGA